MKKLILLSLTLLFSIGIYAQDKNPKHKYPVINGNAPHVLKWDTLAIDMGKLRLGVPATVKFVYTNTGNSPIVITEVHPTCSCTSPDYTKYPVPHGNKGFVSATYNAAVPGKFTKSLAVTTNTGEIDILVITGEVISQ
jgi:hypothetical protein